MRTIITIAVLSAALLPTAAWAQACGQLKIVDRVQMERTPAGLDLMPVLVNGEPKKFLFDTDGFTTGISPSTVADLKLDTFKDRIETIQQDGTRSNDAVTLKTFQFGHLQGKDVHLPVYPSMNSDGQIALEALRTTDIDVDFGTDTMNMFSTDHCAGQIQYWKAPAVAVVPITWRNGYSMRVTAMLDGHEVIAEIETGVTRTIIYSDRAESFYDLKPGDPGMEEQDTLANGQKTYEHVFKSLTFGGTVTVNNPHMIVYPRASINQFDKAQLVGDRTKTERDLFDFPDVIIGMNVLRKLHMYIAMDENKLYFSDASGVVHTADSQ